MNDRRDSMSKNFEWFLANYDQIYAQHGICHVVIHEERIVRVFSENCEIDAIKWATENYAPGSFNVQFCNGNETGYTVQISHCI